MEMQANAPQLTIRLHILPEVQNNKNNALANKIGREIFNDLTTDYRIESVYTGELGGDITFLIWLSPLVIMAGQTLIDAAANEVASKIVEQVPSMFKQMLQKMKNIKHKTAPVTVEVRLPTHEIKAQGSLANALDELDTTILPALVKLEEQLAQNKDSQQSTEITITTITIKISNS